MQPFKRLFTARMIIAMSTGVPAGTPFEHALGGVVWSAMFTRRTNSSTVTALSPLQLPTHAGAAVAVGGGAVGVVVPGPFVGVAVLEGVVGVAVGGPLVAVAVAAPVVGFAVGVADSDTVVGVAVGGMTASRLIAAICAPM